MSEQIIRTQLVNALTKAQAHMSFEDVVKDFPAAHINSKPSGLPYSFWHLVEHLRIAQADILNYIHNPLYEDIAWPNDYWPARGAVTDTAGWQQTIEQFLQDRAALVSLIENPQTDLYAQIPHGRDGHNILREILLVADHNAYHIGELGILRQINGLW